MGYDYLVVGAGLFGAVFARQVKAAGKSVLVIDRRSHVGGNVYTEEIEGIQVHTYGAHIFHTRNLTATPIPRWRITTGSCTLCPSTCIPSIKCGA